MKKFFRKIAVFFVTVYARRIYNNAVKTADARHKKEGVMIYVASETFRPDHLTTHLRQVAVQEREEGIRLSREDYDTPDSQKRMLVSYSRHCRQSRDVNL